MLKRFYTIFLLFSVLFSASAYSDFIECQITKDKDNNPLKVFIPITIKHSSFNMDSEEYIDTTINSQTYRFDQKYTGSSNEIQLRANRGHFELYLIKEGYNQWSLRYNIGNKAIGTGRCAIPVEVCDESTISRCNNDTVCRRATAFTAGIKVWHNIYNSNYNYVTEAKKRGLSCGVASSSSTPSIETKVPSVVPKKKPQIPTKSSPSLIDPLHVTKYGKTYHTALLPKVIFFIGEIEDGDEQGFRRALRSHDVDTVVLLSGGGLIYNGLGLANIIFDNNLTTYIPAGKLCASACSFMFFAGNPKVAHGRLGVHQFYAEDDKKKVEIGKVQKGTQLLVADIIRNLTDFGTPPYVFSKMFSTSGMYFFSEEEKRSFSDSNKISPETVARINEVLSYFIKDIDDELNDVVLNGMPQGVKSRLIQLELLRIGCMQGPVDGVQGEATKAAIQLLSSKRGSNLSALKFSDLFRSLNNTKQEACY